MRNWPFALVALSAAACSSAAGVGESNEHAASPLDPVTAYALTYAPYDPSMKARVAEIARTSDDAVAAHRLAELGEAARRALEDLSLDDPKFARIAAPWLEKLNALRAETLRSNLHFNVGWLETAGPAAAARLDRILPPEASRTDAGNWWALHGAQYRWAPAEDRFLRWDEWPEDESPLRFDGLDRVRLAETKNLVWPGSAFTAEMWVRWPNGAAACYLVGDEAWPGMDSAHVPVEANCGWNLRGNPREPGARQIQFVGGIAPSAWYGPMSPFVPASQEWEHVAVVATGKTVRVFLNGECIVAERCDGVRFLRCSTDLFLGVREFGHSTRGANQDVRAFRLSEGARYTGWFTPPQRFEKDGATLCLLDFTAGTETLRDLSGNGHDGHVEGPQWVGTLSPSRVRAALGSSSADVVFAEAEHGLCSGEWYLAERPSYSGGVIAEIWSDHDVNAAGHWIEVPFRVPTSGTWRVHFAGASLHRLGPKPGVSPFAWRIDDGPWDRETESLPEANAPGVPAGDLSPIGDVRLDAGDHVFRLRLLSRRESGDHRWSIWFDGIALERVRD